MAYTCSPDGFVSAVSNMRAESSFNAWIRASTLPKFR